MPNAIDTSNELIGARAIITGIHPLVAPAMVSLGIALSRILTLRNLQAGIPDLHAVARTRFEQALLNAALEHTGGRRAEAAALLGVGRNTVTRKLGPTRTRR